jgi:hypothetical protein
MAPMKWKNKKKEVVVMPLSMASSTESPTPSSVTVPSIGPNIQENPTLNDIDYTRARKTKKPKKTALAVSFSTTSSPPLITSDDLFVASLLSDGLKVSNTNNTPPILPKKKKPYQ